MEALSDVDKVSPAIGVAEVISFSRAVRRLTGELGLPRAAGDGRSVSFVPESTLYITCRDITSDESYDYLPGVYVTVWEELDCQENGDTIQLRRSYGIVDELTEGMAETTVVNCDEDFNLLPYTPAVGHQDTPAVSTDDLLSQTEFEELLMTYEFTIDDFNFVMPLLLRLNAAFQTTESEDEVIQDNS